MNEWTSNKLSDEHKTKSSKSTQDNHSKSSTNNNTSPSQSNNHIYQRKPAEARLPTDTDDSYCKYHKTHNHGWTHCRKNPITQNNKSNSNNQSQQPREDINNIEERQDPSDDSSGIIRDEELYEMDAPALLNTSTPTDNSTTTNFFSTTPSNSSKCIENWKIVMFNDDFIPPSSDKTEDFVPEILCAIDKSIATTTNKKTFLSLLDTGASTSILVESTLPYTLRTHCKIDPTGSCTWHTKAGTFTTSKIITFAFHLPQFHSTNTITYTFKVDSTSTNSPSKYPIIMGRDLCRKLGLQFNFNTTPPTITFNNISTPMSNHTSWTRKKNNSSYMLTQATISNKNSSTSTINDTIASDNNNNFSETIKIITDTPVTSNRTIEDANAVLVTTSDR